MQPENNLTSDANFGNPSEQTNVNYPTQQSSGKSFYPIVAGILLIISGAVALLYWIFVIINADLFTSMIDVSYLESLDPNITLENVKQTLVLCGTIFVIVAIFPLLGGFLALKKKLWGVALACSIIGLFSMGVLFTSSILSLVGLILLAISKKEFQQQIN